MTDRTPPAVLVKSLLSQDCTRQAETIIQLVMEAMQITRAEFMAQVDQAKWSEE